MILTWVGRGCGETHSGEQCGCTGACDESNVPLIVMQEVSTFKELRTSSQVIHPQLLVASRTLSENDRTEHITVT